MGESPTVTLNNGRKMPMLGLGVYKATGPNEVESAIACAIENGYRLFDTASVYKNEEGVGRAIQSASIPREELFITTKLWNTAQRIGDIDGAFFRSLERLSLDYVDLYLIHWPVPGCYPDSWRALEKIYKSGQAHSIGVSNFGITELEHLSQISGIIPAVNQIEYHPLWNQSELCSYCQEKGIIVQAYAPLARGAYAKNELLVKIGEHHGKSATQAGLRWLIQKGICPIPKSTTPERIFSNINIFDFKLTPQEMDLIDSLDIKYQSASIPEDMR